MDILPVWSKGVNGGCSCSNPEGSKGLIGGCSCSNPVQDKGLVGGSSYSNPLNHFADVPVWGATQRGPSTIGESSELASGWTVFRMLIPKEQIKYDKNVIDKICKETETEIDIYPAEVTAGVTVVMVSAEERPGSPTRRAVRCFREVHQYFFDRSVYPFRVTRLLVPAAPASSLLVNNRIKTIADESRCSIEIYLTDIVSILSPGDVIIMVVGKHECVDNAIELIASDLIGFTVDEDMMLDLRIQGGIPTPYSVVYANECNSGKDQCKSSDLDVQAPVFEDLFEDFGRGGKSKVFESMNFENGILTPENVISAIVGDAGKYNRFDDLKTRRISELRHHTTIPLFVARCIMGLNGENINTIQQSCLASIILKPGHRDNEIIILICGRSGYEVEVAKSLMEGYIGFPALDDMFEGFSQLCLPCGEEEWF